MSFFAVCDGRRAIPLGSAQDHKRVFDDDRGPNTGGMGAFAPSPLMDAELEARVMRDVVEPVVAGMREEGHEYRGFLYVGLMLTCDGPKVIEFNVRFGDPEAQVVLPLLETDLPALLAAAAGGDLGSHAVTTGGGVAVGVVLASGGYPGPVKTGVPIHGIDAASRIPGVDVFHAATARRGAELVTAGGRVSDRRRPRPHVRRRDRAGLRGRVEDRVRRDAVPARHRSQGDGATREPGADVTELPCSLRPRRSPR